MGQSEVRGGVISACRSLGFMVQLVRPPSKADAIHTTLEIPDKTVNVLSLYESSIRCT